MTTMKGLQSQINIPYEQEFELYHNALSLCSMKTRVCLAELQIPYRSHHIDLIETGRYENIRKPFLKINPGGTVPVLVHHGHPVYESHEQIRYAARHAPATSPGLMPASPEQLSEMEYWIDRSSLTDDPLNNGNISAGNAVPGQTLPLFATMIEKIPYRSIFVGFLFHFDKRRPLMFTLLKLLGLQALNKIPPFSKMLSLSRKQMHAHMDALESQLQGSAGPWILGDFFSLADVSWLVIFERLQQADALQVFADADTRPACAAYWEQLKARPSYRQAIVEHDHPLIEYGTGRICELKAKNPAFRELLEG